MMRDIEFMYTDYLAQDIKQQNDELNRSHDQVSIQQLEQHIKYQLDETKTYWLEADLIIGSDASQLGFEYEKDNHCIKLTYHWFKLFYVLALCIMPPSFLFFSIMSWSIDVVVLNFIFMIIFMLASMITFYTFIVLIVNKTEIEIDLNLDLLVSDNN